MTHGIGGTTHRKNKQESRTHRRNADIACAEPSSHRLRAMLLDNARPPLGGRILPAAPGAHAVVSTAMAMPVAPHFDTDLGVRRVCQCALPKQMPLKDSEPSMATRPIKYKLRRTLLGYLGNVCAKLAQLAHVANRAGNIDDRAHTHTDTRALDFDNDAAPATAACIGRTRQCEFATAAGHRLSARPRFGRGAPAKKSVNAIYNETNDVPWQVSLLYTMPRHCVKIQELTSVAYACGILPERIEAPYQGTTTASTHVAVEGFHESPRSTTMPV